MIQPSSAGAPTPRALAATYAKRAREAAEQSKIRSGDVMRPAIDAIAEAPGIIIEVTEGAAKAAAAEITTQAQAVAQQVNGARETLVSIAKERENQVMAAKIEIQANSSKIAAAMADLLKDQAIKFIASDRLRRSCLGFGLACIAALALTGSGYLIGVRSGQAEARAEMVGDTAERLSALIAASGDAATAVQTAKAIVGPLQIFAGLSLQQQADLVTLVRYNHTPLPGEDVPFPCVAAGPKHLIEIQKQQINTCIVGIPLSTRISGNIFNIWLKGVIAAGTKDLKPWGDLTRWAYPLKPAS